MDADQVRSPPLRYDSAAMAFHWGIAALVLLDFVCAVSFGKFDPGDSLYVASAYPLHMSIGMLILILAALCILRRLTAAYPRPLAEMSTTMRRMARTAHVLLYCYIVVLPVTGWMVLSLRRRPPVLLGAAHWPSLGFLADLPHEVRTRMHDLLLPAHVWLGYIGMGLVAVHVLAGLYHHFYRHDEVLSRMLPRSASGRMAARSALDERQPGAPR